VATTLPALRRYQLESAWVWEHQALVRTRVVAGDLALKTSLEALRREVLAMPREQSELASAVCNMRDKMRSEHNASSNRHAHFDLKRDPGGIVDIEFVVQYLVLAHAGEHAELTIWSDVIRLLEALEQTGLIAANEAKMLSRAYLDYRSATHSLGLQGRAAETDAAEFEAQRQQVKQITEALLPGLQAG